MIGFEAAINNITAEQKAKLEISEKSRTKDHIILPNVFVGILNETADPQKIIETMRRKFRNWAIPHQKSKRAWITPISTSQYLQYYGGSERLIGETKHVIQQTLQTVLTNIRAKVGVNFCLRAPSAETRLTVHCLLYIGP